MSIRSLRSLRVLLAPVFALGLAAPAPAQGPLGPPDDSGPATADYSGFAVLYLINGVRRDPSDNQETEIICTNVGTTNANWAVQVFDRTMGTFRTPVCESTLATSIPVADIDSISTDGANSDIPFAGTCPSGDGDSGAFLGRVIVNPKKAALVCSARVIFALTRNVVADLPVTPVGKAPKIKIK